MWVVQVVWSNWPRASASRDPKPYLPPPACVSEQERGEGTGKPCQRKQETPEEGARWCNRKRQRRSCEVTEILQSGLVGPLPLLGEATPPASLTRMLALLCHKRAGCKRHINSCVVDQHKLDMVPAQSPNHSVTPPLLGSGFCLCFSSSMNFSCISSMEPSASVLSFFGKMSGKVKVWP